MDSADFFETIIREYYEALFRFAISLTRAESDARDLTQQTFYIWARKGHQLREPGKAKTWLFTTLHRAFLDRRRRQVRFPHHDLEEVAQELPVLAPNHMERVDSSNVLSLLAQIDEIYQGTVALFYLEDYSYKEIAAILEVPVGTVKSRLARGIAQLRELVSGENSKTGNEARQARQSRCAGVDDHSLAIRNKHSPTEKSPLSFLTPALTDGG